MKKMRYGFAMLDIYEVGDELVYNDTYGEELSRWICRCSEEPFEDVTSEADWMISSENLRAFLAKSDDTLIEKSKHMFDSSLKDAYRISEIESFVVYGDGAIALFKRNGDGKFYCSQMYMSGRDVPQSFWEAMYPDTYERALAKVRSEFFSEEIPIWYFVGEHRHVVYRVTPDAINMYSEFYDDDGEDAAFSEGVKNGLNPDFFHEGDAGHWAYFDPEALKGTAYPRKKLDTPEGFLAAAESCHYVEELLWGGYYGSLLTDEEYFGAAEELKWQEHYRTHPEESVA